MNAYVESVIARVKKEYPYQPEFIQTVEEVLSSLSNVVDTHPEYEKADLLNRIVQPDRTVSFRVVYQDDQGAYHTHKGYRVQFNGAVGPYKGGLRFQENVTEGLLKVPRL